jgi:hypothetical protein
MTGKIKIEILGIYFRCLEKKSYPCTELISLRLNRCSSCGECEYALPRIVPSQVFEDERCLTKEDGSLD